jgi:hypothetical protein
MPTLPNNLRLFGTALVLFAAAACSSSTSSPTVSVIAISPTPCGVGRTDSLQMSAVATLPDGTKETVTASPGIAWSTGNSNTATISASGVLVGVNAGITAVTVDYQGATSSINCTVAP